MMRRKQSNRKETGINHPAAPDSHQSPLIALPPFSPTPPPIKATSGPQPQAGEGQPIMSRQPPPPPPSSTSAQPLRKQQSWSPDMEREDTWARRKGLHRDRRGRISRSVTDEDVDELRGCIDLGFGFEMGDPADEKLLKLFPALDLCYAVHRSYCDSTASRSSSVSEADLISDGSNSPISIVSPGDTPELMKARLKQWAQVVACSVRQRY